VPYNRLTPRRDRDAVQEIAMTRLGLRFALLAAAVAAFSLTPVAGADDPAPTEPAPTLDPAPAEAPAPEPPALTSATTDSGYEVTLTGPVNAVVGTPTSYTATCGGGYACPYGEFRAYGEIINHLGEGFGRGATGTITFRAPGFYSLRYRVGAACQGSPRLACPIDVWINAYVEAAPDAPAPDTAAPDATAPDATAPDATAPDATAPDTTAPDAAATA
jgi:hypothetical protein